MNRSGIPNVGGAPFTYCLRSLGSVRVGLGLFFLGFGLGRLEPNKSFWVGFSPQAWSELGISLGWPKKSSLMY